MNSLVLRGRYVVLSLTLCAWVGCDKISEVIDDPGKAVQEQVQAVQEKATQAIETVKESVGDSGQAELTLDKPVSGAKCFATLVQPGADRTPILEIKSYSSVDLEGFPSYMFHAAAPANSWDALTGQQVSGQLFVRFAADEPIWYTQPDQLVQVNITKSDGQTLEAEIVGGSLVSTDGTPLPAVSGKFHAVVRTPK